MKEIWNSDIHDESTPTVVDVSPRVVVAIDKDKGSQIALKWAVDNLLNKVKIVTFVHVRKTSPNTTDKRDLALAREIFIPFRCFCTRKDIQCRDIVLEDSDIARAIVEYATLNATEKLVVGSPTRSAFVRFKTTDVGSSVAKNVPDFCTVYMISSKGKISHVKNATRQAPIVPHVRHQMQSHPSSLRTDFCASPPQQKEIKVDVKGEIPIHHPGKNEVIRSPFSRGRPPQVRSYDELTISESDLSSLSSTSTERMFPSPYDDVERPPRSSNGSSGYDTCSPEKMHSPFISPFNRQRPPNGRSYGELTLSETDVSSVSSGRPSIERMLPSSFEDMEGHRPSRLCYVSSGNDYSSFEMMRSPFMSANSQSPTELECASQRSGGNSWSSRSLEDIDGEMRRLRLELRQTMDMYGTACKETLTEKQRDREPDHWNMEENRRLQESWLTDEEERESSETTIKCATAAEAALRLAELESQKRKEGMKELMEAEDKKAMTSFVGNEARYRKYSIDEIEVATEYFSQSLKIGEGGYGPVYKCVLDHTEVAVKVLRPDATQGRSQFQQEIEVLSCMRHPNMVLLLGACPQYGCLVYEYMANGSLQDRLFRKGNTPALSWQLRFQIAAEIGTGLLFLHQSKPKPLVHRDLKPDNILLDHNFVSKISDVGLARLVPPSVANAVTQYRMTSAAGTFCYIDPEYQQTGMLGIKSDVYSFGILLLQIITARPPMGLAHAVENAIEEGTFERLLDPEVKDWPVEEALSFAKVALGCAELRKRDRPDLGTVVLPELNRLRTLAKKCRAA